MNMIRSTCAFALATFLAATTASAQDATFEVAAIKPSNPDPSNPLSMIPMIRPQPGGRVTANNMPLKALIGFAYELQDFRVDGGPAALMNAKFDIVAKASGSATLTPKEMMPLVKNLLIERFKLKVHTEPREIRVYDLVVARSDGRLGPDIRPSKSDCSNADELNAKRGERLAKGDLSAIVPKPGEVFPCTISPNVAGGPANFALHGDGQEIKQLIEVLTPFAGRPVRDKTGLTGRYDFDMKLDIQQVVAMARGMGMNIPAGAEAKLPPSDGSSLMTTLNEQLGLKLDSVRAPFDVLIVDSVEAPAPD
jgi:uncharacterized protein (TIGR03435 family)